MNIVAIIYVSGYGHTAKQAEAVAEGIKLAGSIGKVEKTELTRSRSARDPRRILDMPLELRAATSI